MEKAFARSNDSLSAIYEFAQEILATNSVGGAACYSVHLALEELFVNMVKYNPNVSSDIEVNVDVIDDKVKVTLTEYGVPKFDVTAPRDVDIEAPLAERTPGGLGVYLIQNLADSLEYEYVGGRSRVIFTKKTEV
ncbi:MAG: ATP-binding protein [Gammaproteobacteria bacterium]|nr:ATP-binding protein [Gammaproteobacteria bacterium]MDH5259840.1 ATP-binding protein [Gammaproteobacteria bacterium]MDH5583845.1 ATP-binding protein [Gammaproteobacteria bacterium]